MATRNLRNRVPSRQPSPVNGVQADTASQPGKGDTGRDGESHDPDVWVEPAVRRLPPSYQDHKGLERVGVLELQQPLGEPPSSKLLQRLKLHVPRASPRPLSVQNEEGVTPGAESERQDFPSPIEVDASAGPALLDQDQEDTVVSTSFHRGRPSNREVAEMRHPVDLTEATPSPTSATFSNYQQQQAQKPASIQEHLRQDRVQNYLERAIHEAEQKGEPGLIPGLTKMREDAYQKRELWAVLEAITSRQPNEEQLRIFRRYIKKGVKRHRRGTMSPKSVGVDSPLPNSAAFQPLLPSATENPPALSPRQPISTFTSPFRPRPDSSHLQVPEQRSPKGSSASPSKRRHRMPGSNDRNPRQGKSTSSPRHRRSRSMSTQSSLSSARSLSPPAVGPFAVAGNEAVTGEDGPVRNGVSRQAPDRISAGNRTRQNAQFGSKHPFASFNTVNKINDKRLKRLREDLDFDPAQVEKRRKEFLADSLHEYNYRHYEEAHDRYHVPYLDDDYPSTRSEIYIPPPIVHPYPVPPASSGLRGGADGPQMDHRNGTSRKRRFEEIEEDEDEALTPLSSSPAPVFAPPPPAGVAASRAGTPRAAKLPAANKRKSARVLISPNKPKNGGITAGIQRAGPGRDSAIGNNADSGAEDNDNFCASCGGEGILLCCDGCTRSMHHACLEPPLDPDAEIEDEWFCPSCMAGQGKPSPDTPGFLGKVINTVQNIIPKAFVLPTDVRDYFDGVRTGESGEYEEFGQPTTQQAPKMNRAGFIEEPNYKEPRDSKGKLITCCKCGLGTNGRDIIPCSYCPARWHLDCCDPPLAIPPRRRAGDKPGATWRCPLHVEQDLAGLGRQVEAAPGDLGRQVRPRKPKNAKIRDVDMPRGFRNNGVIEVELMEEEIPAIKEVDMNGRVFRLPEKGIRLDFIDRVKRSWYEDDTLGRSIGDRPLNMRRKLYQPESAPVYHTPRQVIFKRKEPSFWNGSQALAVVETARANVALRQKTFAEQQAIVGLAEMSQNKFGYSGDAVAALTNQLIMDAPPETEILIERGEKDSLLRLQTLINRRLKILENVDIPHEPKHLKPFERKAPVLLAPKPPAGGNMGLGGYVPVMPMLPNYNQDPHALYGQGSYGALGPYRQNSYGSAGNVNGHTPGANSNGVQSPINGQPLAMTNSAPGTLTPRPPNQGDAQQQGQILDEFNPELFTHEQAQQPTSLTFQDELNDPSIDPRLFEGDYGLDGAAEDDDQGADGDVEMDGDGETPP